MQVPHDFRNPARGPVSERPFPFGTLGGRWLRWQDPLIRLLGIFVIVMGMVLDGSA
jgi:hypothetical protein